MDLSVERSRCRDHSLRRRRRRLTWPHRAALALRSAKMAKSSKGCSVGTFIRPDCRREVNFPLRGRWLGFPECRAEACRLLALEEQCSAAEGTEIAFSSSKAVFLVRCSPRCCSKRPHGGGRPGGRCCLPPLGGLIEGEALGGCPRGMPSGDALGGCRAGAPKARA